MEDWRAWIEDVLGFLESANKGMKEFLQMVAREDVFPSDFWFLEKRETYGDRIADDGPEIWRTLKAITKGEALKIVKSVKPEQGFLAWHKLVHHFQPGLATLQGKALSDLSAMIVSRAKTPAETKEMVTDMETKINTARTSRARPFRTFT